MTRATPITDEQLFELLRETDPLADSGLSSAIETDLVGVDGERLLRRILSSERISTPRPGWQRSRRRRLVLRAASGGAVAATAVAAVLIFTAGSAPSIAFAGWSADPTAPVSGQVQAAESHCRRNSALASITPTLADTRGPYTLLVYSGSVCVTGPSLQSPTGEPPVVPFGAFLAASSEAERRALPSTTSHAPSTTSVAPDAIRTTVAGGANTAATAYSFDVGQVGANVTAVTLVLEDGSRVEATSSNGWFAAWWPGNQPATTAEIATTSGTATQQLIPEGASLPANGGPWAGTP